VKPVSEHQLPVYDFAEAIFGFLKDGKNKEDKRTEFPSRVFFEEGKTDETNWKFSKEALQPKVLSSPKPTSFNLYLKQPQGWETLEKNLNHWDDEQAPIRGYKLYWHRKNSDNKSDNHSWVDNGERNPNRGSLSPKIIPVKEDVTFSSRIRFENLTSEELGCLLFALELPEGCCHKLGMGKPLGLGSVHITPELTIINRKNRYATLFNEEGNWNTSEESETDLKSYKDAFEKFICGKLGIPYKGSDSLWMDARFRQLKTMLTFEHDIKEEEWRGWSDRTKYMDIDNKGFKYRPVLPYPEDVVYPPTYKRR
jgi:CRISPR-associated protein (TIGR03986 family)